MKAAVLPASLGVLMLVTAVLAYAMTPRPDPGINHPPLAQVIPQSFGDWHAISTPTQVINPAGEREAKDPFFELYDDVLMRAYANSRGNVILLALAYGRHQRQEFKIHRPELCYISQGFKLVSHNRVVFPIRDSRQQPVLGSRMIVQSAARVEIVSYWIRIGDLFSESPWTTRYYLFKQGIRGRVLDGILVRVSQVVGAADDDSAEGYRLQERFLAELVGAAPAAADALLIG